jgi:peroxiredoxin
VEKKADEIRHLWAEVLVVTQASPPQLTAFLRDHPTPFRLAGDPTRGAYRRFQLGRTSWGTILRPRSIWHYLKLLFRGWTPQRPGREEDVLQLGGDFILNEEGQVVYSHPSKDSTDRPAVDQLVFELRKVKEHAARATE